MKNQWSETDNSTVLCLSNADCNERRPFICESSLALSLRSFSHHVRLPEVADRTDTHNETSSLANVERAWSALIAPALNLVGSLFGSGRM